MTPTPTVLQVLRDRAGGRADDFRVAVAVEGGGMRGVVSGAMLIALRDIGIADHVDTYFGTSSGSINITYFAAGAAWDALSVYYDHLPNGFVRRRPKVPFETVLDMEYLRRVMTQLVPLDMSALAQSHRDTKVVLAAVDDRAIAIADMREHAMKAIDYLLAGSWLPLLAGRPFELDGRRYLDGGVLWADPIYAPIEAGYTHVLSLNTNAQGDYQSEHSKRLRLALTQVLNRWSAGLGDGYALARRNWDRDSKLLGFERSVPLDGTLVHRLAPSAGSHRVSRLTMDRALLLEGARAGYATILNAFGIEAPLYFSLTTSANRVTALEKP